jgi:hypothetical protein
VVVLAAGALLAWMFLPERDGPGETMPAERNLNGLKREMPYVSYADIL